MNRTTELARQAIKRTEVGWDLLESIALAIRTALAEQARLADPVSGLPPAMSSAVTLLRRWGELTPTQVAGYRGTKIDAARFLLLRMHKRRIVRRIRRGHYVLSGPWLASREKPASGSESAVA